MFSMNGKIVVKNDTQQIKDTFKKREFVISDEGSQYPQEIMFQLVQDKCDLIDPYQIGDEIKVNFNIRGRRWENPKTGEIRFFNSLDAWRIEKASAGTVPADDTPPPLLDDMPPENEEMDDLPF